MKIQAFFHLLPAGLNGGGVVQAGRVAEGGEFVQAGWVPDQGGGIVQAGVDTGTGGPYMQNSDGRYGIWPGKGGGSGTIGGQCCQWPRTFIKALPYGNGGQVGITSLLCGGRVLVVGDGEALDGLSFGVEAVASAIHSVHNNKEYMPQLHPFVPSGDSGRTLNTYRLATTCLKLACLVLVIVHQELVDIFGPQYIKLPQGEGWQAVSS